MIRQIIEKKGFILVATSCFSLLLILIVIPLINWSVNEFGWTSRSFLALQALNLADAGAELAVWEIAHNNEQFSSWSGLNPRTVTLSSFTDDNGKVIGDITVSANQTSPRNYTVTSTGLVPNAQKPIVKKTVKVLVFPNALFNNGIFGKTSVTMSGNTYIDSYDSSVGPYSALTAGSNGDVGTNGVLTMSENSLINGDALIGLGGSASGVTSRVSGEIFYSGNEVELPPVTLPDYFSGLTNSGNLSLSSDDTMVIPSGNYFYQTISLSAKSSLTINSNTNIYVSEGFSISGQAVVSTNSVVTLYIGGNGDFSGQGIVNNSGIPSGLQIYALGDGTSLSYSGKSNFYGIIYAPESTVSASGNASYFGAIIGDTVNFSGNGGFHYDETLSDNGPSSGFSIAYWQED